MFPWGRRGSASQAAGGDGPHHHQQDHDSAYINNKYDEDDILGAMKENHYNDIHSRRLSNNVSSFHPTNASRYNVSNSHSNSNGQAENERGQSRSNRSSQRYSHLQNSNSTSGHYGHQLHDSVQPMQQFYHLHEYRRSEDHSSIRYYSTGEYHLDLTATSRGGYQEQQQGFYGYTQSPRTPDRGRERKVVVNRTSMDHQMDESEGQNSPPPPSRSAIGTALSSFTTATTTPGAGTGTSASPTQQQQRTVSKNNVNNCENGNDNNSPTTIVNKTLVKLTQARRHTYSGSLASSTTSSISSSSSSSSSSTVVSTTTSPVQLSPSSSPSPSSQTPQTPQTPRSRMSFPAVTPSLSSPSPSTPGSSGGRYNITTVINTTTALGASTGALELPSTSTATTSLTATVATSNTLSSPSSSTSSPSTLNNRHSLHSLPGDGSPSSSSSSMVTIKTKAFEGGVNFNKRLSSPPSPSSPLSIFKSPPRPLSLQQYRQEYQVSRPMTAHLNASLAGGEGGVGGKRRSLLLRMENAYSMGDTDRQGNLMIPATTATNGAAIGGGKAGARTGTGVSTIAGAGGGGADGGQGGGGDGMMEFGGMLNAEDEGNNEDTGPEPCYVFSVPHWETVKAGLLPTSKPAREALMATIVLALITIALEAVLLHRHNVMTASLTGSVPTGSSGGGGGMSYELSFFRPLTVYYCIFILAEVFAVGLLWDAAIHKNSLQLVAFTLFEWCMVSYSVLQVWQHDQLVKDIAIPAEVLKGLDNKTTRMILFSELGFQTAACLGITLLTWRLYSEFGWLVFQKLGADVSLRKMMKEYRMLFTLLKLDAFFFFGYAIQVAALTDKHWQKGLEEIAFAIPLSGIILLLGFCALRNENKVTMGGFISCLGLLIAYMIYRLVALYQTLTGDASTDPYFFSRKTMTVFAALTLFMTVLALVYAVVMLYNFNKGLKEAMQQYRVRRSGTIRSVTPSTHRMSVNGGYGVSAIGLQYSQHGLGGDVGVVGVGGKRLSNHHQSDGMNGMVGLGSGFGDGSGGTIGGGNGGGGGGGKSSKRFSRRSLLYCEPVVVVPAMIERWPIE